jgi:hypothetical protein
MVAQTATRRMSRTQVQRLSNLQRELAGSAPVAISTDTTTTITIVFTTSTGAITIDRSTT